MSLPSKQNKSGQYRHGAPNLLELVLSREETENEYVSPKPFYGAAGCQESVVTFKALLGNNTPPRSKGIANATLVFNGSMRRFQRPGKGSNPLCRSNFRHC